MPPAVSAPTSLLGNASVPESEWCVLFHAVVERLGRTVDAFEGAPPALRECSEALQWLRGQWPAAPCPPPALDAADTHETRERRAFREMLEARGHDSGALRA